MNHPHVQIVCQYYEIELLQIIADVAHNISDPLLMKNRWKKHFNHSYC